MGAPHRRGRHRLDNGPVRVPVDHVPEQAAGLRMTPIQPCGVSPGGVLGVLSA